MLWFCKINTNSWVKIQNLSFKLAKTSSIIGLKKFGLKLIFRPNKWVNVSDWNLVANVVSYLQTDQKLCFLSDPHVVWPLIEPTVQIQIFKQPTVPDSFKKKKKIVNVISVGERVDGNNVRKLGHPPTRRKLNCLFAPSAPVSDQTH